MKKLFSLIGLIVLVATTSQTVAQKDRRFRNGFGVSLETGFPSSDFGVEKGGSAGKYETGNCWGVQLGNRWYFSPTEKYGFGLMANWADLTVTTVGGYDYLSDWARTVGVFSFVEVGPVATYALNDKMAIDGYYNLCPTMMSTIFSQRFPMGASDVQTTYSGFGVTHTIGAALRYSIFNLGLEYVMGSVDCAGQKVIGSSTTALENKQLKVNNFRILLGLKF